MNFINNLYIFSNYEFQCLFSQSKEVNFRPTQFSGLNLISLCLGDETVLFLLAALVPDLILAMSDSFVHSKLQN